MKSIVVIGGGFAGLEFAKQLGSLDYQITLIDQTNHHLFQPLLYQVAGAQLSSTDIASPIRELFKHRSNIRVLLEEVISIDQANRLVYTREHAPIAYDKLVLALGNQSKDPADPSWAPHVHKLKNLEDALKIREKILLAYEEAEWSGKAPHFVIIGGGPTGVEMAGTLAELARGTLHQNFRHICSENTRLTLLEHSEHILAIFPKQLRLYAEKTLSQMGVDIRFCQHIQSIGEGKIQLETDLIEADLIIWAAGTKGSKLSQNLGLPLHKDGRLVIDTFMRVEGCQDIYAIGDCAGLEQDGKLLPSLAPVAKQQGRYLAHVFSKNFQSIRPFHYFDKGNLATIGKKKAVGEASGLAFKGYLAWLVWAIVHIYYLVGFSSKILILSRWLWSYITGGRSSRLVRKKAKSA